MSYYTEFRPRIPYLLQIKLNKMDAVISHNTSIIGDSKCYITLGPSGHTVSSMIQFAHRHPVFNTVKPVLSGNSREKAKVAV